MREKERKKTSGVASEVVGHSELGPGEEVQRGLVVRLCVYPNKAEQCTTWRLSRPPNGRLDHLDTPDGTQ